MDLTRSIEPNSAQVNAEDLLMGPRTVTITGVEEGSGEQPVFVHLEEFPNRTYRPNISMRRVLAKAWGPNSENYTGRKLTLFRNPKIRFGKEETGGIQISHMSHLDGPLTLPLMKTRGKREPFTVQPLEAAPADTSGRDWLKELADTEGDVSAIEALGKAAAKAHAPETTLSEIRTAYQQAIHAADVTE